ncbi:MAG: helix-turn-helix transcriptional regulator [Spirochaetes bacterium]|nr:helix-turn-helix transcriptional regulator [Spirochaetota bacterium]
MPAAAFYLKLSGVAVLLFIATYLFGRGAAPRRIASGLFALSLAGYLGCQVCHPLPIAWLIVVIHIGCYSVPVAFYVMGEALFKDNFCFQAKHLLLLLSVEFINFGIFFFVQNHAGHTSLASGLAFAPACVSLALIAVTFANVVRGRVADLVEIRRRFRLQFLTVTGAAMLLVLAKEVVYPPHDVPPLLDFIHAAAVLALVWYFGLRLLRSGADSFGEETREKKATAPAAKYAPLLAKLDQAMTSEKIYMRENLSIGRLAEHLGTREYILRRAINSGLGYRNFNDFLNEARIREAQRLLSSDAAPAILHLAMDLGFGSLAPFNRAFKEKTGVSPSEFRKKN